MIKRSLPRVIATFLMVLLSATAATGEFRNAGNDPVLAAAFRSDTEMNGGDETLGNREEAERHYLRFIAESHDSAQRARAYVQLGVLYATNLNLARSEKANYAKSVAYMRMALAVEPNRVDDSMLRARMFLISPTMDDQAKFTERIANYQWLTSLDAGTVKKLWLPTAGSNAEDEVRFRATFMRLLANVVRSECVNLLAAARTFQNEKAALVRLAGELSDTDVAAQAKKRINDLAGAVSDHAHRVRNVQDRPRCEVQIGPCVGPANDSGSDRGKMHEHVIKEQCMPAEAGAP